MCFFSFTVKAYFILNYNSKIFLKKIFWFSNFLFTQLSPYQLKLKNNCMFFRGWGLNWKLRTEVKNTGNINGGFEICFKISLSSLIFIYIRWLVPVILKTNILIPNFIFLFSSFFFSERERRNCCILTYRKKIIIRKNLSHQKSLLLCQNVLYKGRLRLGVFFTLKTPI